jgi:hypothetical protein
MSEGKIIIRDEIVRQVENLINFERLVLSDFVDFSSVMTQKFEKVLVKGNDLILRKDKKERKLKIKNNKALVEKTIIDKYRSEELEFEREKIRLSELKSLPTIDFERQTALKDYIDDLVFALYFNIRITKIGLKHAKQIKNLCKKNKLYKILTANS